MLEILLKMMGKKRGGGERGRVFIPLKIYTTYIRSYIHTYIQAYACKHEDENVQAQKRIHIY